MRILVGIAGRMTLAGSLAAAAGNETPVAVETRLRIEVAFVTATQAAVETGARIEVAFVAATQAAVEKAAAMARPSLPASPARPTRTFALIGESARIVRKVGVRASAPRGMADRTENAVTLATATIGLPVARPVRRLRRLATRLRARVIRRFRPTLPVPSYRARRRPSFEPRRRERPNSPDATW